MKNSLLITRSAPSGTSPQNLFLGIGSKLDATKRARLAGLLPSSTVTNLSLHPDLQFSQIGFSEQEISPLFSKKIKTEKEWIPISAKFDIDAEFPRLFLPQAFHVRRSSEVSEQVIQETREQVELALQSIFKRMVLPVPHPDRIGEFKSIRFFDEIDKIIQNEGLQNIEIYPSGGVVRSALGYLYYEMWEAYWRGEPVERVLMNIIHDSSDIPGHMIRGVGSDFDVLIKTDNNDDFITAKNLVLELINSTEKSLNAYRDKHKLKSSLFTIGDVKNFDEQMERSVRQGGSTLDFLVFDLKFGKLIEPEEHPNIVRDFFLGYYSYVKPRDEKFIEKPLKQTVRGFRPLLEMPFLSVKDESILREEIRSFSSVVSDISFDSSKSSDFTKAIEQFGKMMRNSRFSAAHNRFYRVQDGSIERDIISLSSLASKISSQVLIPEFVDHTPLVTKRKMSLEAHIQNLLNQDLVDIETFIEDYTDEGFLYHGTPSLERSLYILRGGMIVSGGMNQQGVFACGRGGYSSPELSTAQSYAGKNGVVLKLKLKENKNIRILDWENASDELKEWANQLRENGRDPFEVLAREGCVDIIINNHVLIQNMAAVRVPKSPTELFLSITSFMTHHEVSDQMVVDTYRWFVKLAPFLMLNNHKDGVDLGLDFSKVRDRARKAVLQNYSLWTDYPWNPEDEEDQVLAIELVERYKNKLSAKQMVKLLNVFLNKAEVLSFPIENLEALHLKIIKEIKAKENKYKRTSYVAQGWPDIFPWNLQRLDHRELLKGILFSEDVHSVILYEALKALFELQKDDRLLVINEENIPKLISNIKMSILSDDKKVSERRTWQDLIFKLYKEIDDFKSAYAFLNEIINTKQWQHYFSYSLTTLFFDIFYEDFLNAYEKSYGENREEFLQIVVEYLSAITYNMSEGMGFSNNEMDLYYALKVLQDFPDFIEYMNRQSHMNFEITMDYYYRLFFSYYFHDRRALFGLKSFKKTYFFETNETILRRKEIARIVGEFTVQSPRSASRMMSLYLNVQLDADRYIWDYFRENCTDQDAIDRVTEAVNLSDK